LFHFSIQVFNIIVYQCRAVNHDVTSMFTGVVDFRAATQGCDRRSSARRRGYAAGNNGGRAGLFFGAGTGKAGASLLD
jgi:hypothetical protein